jgi:hypothetical protein
LSLPILQALRNLDPKTATVVDVIAKCHKYKVAKPPCDNVRIIPEPLRGIPVRPPARIFQSLRQVPVIKSGKGSDLGFEQRIDQALIEIKALFVRFAASSRLNARPGD